MFASLRASIVIRNKPVVVSLALAYDGSRGEFGKGEKDGQMKAIDNIWKKRVHVTLF
jgi:hypothetical protein